MWSELVESYALRAREFSDAVASLGQEVHLGPEAAGEVLNQIQAKHQSCMAIADEIDRYLKLKADAARAR